MKWMDVLNDEEREHLNGETRPHCFGFGRFRKIKTLKDFDRCFSTCLVRKHRRGKRLPNERPGCKLCKSIFDKLVL
jgi:hypothetical protein